MKNSNTSFRATLLVTAILSPNLYAANNFDDLSLDSLLNLKVVTASKREQSVSDAPATVQVITQKDIKDRGYSTLKDVFLDLPGMDVHEQYFSETGTLVAVRGIAGNNKIIALVNGMRINPPGNEALPIRTDISVRSAKQIEVIYGPGSTLYGNDAINMVVNIITENPEDESNFKAAAIAGVGNAAGGDDRGDHKEAFVSFGKTFDQSETDFSMSGFVHVTNAELDNYADTFPEWYNAYVTRDGTNTPSIASGPVRDDEGFNAMLKLEGENSTLTFWHRESSRSSGEGGFTPVLQSVPEAIWHDKTTVMEAKHLFSATEQVELESSLLVSKYEIDPKSRYVFNPSQGAPLFLQDWKYGSGLGANLEERIIFTPNDDLSITGGLVFAYRDILPKATVNRSDEDGFNADLAGANSDLDILGQGQPFVWYEDDGGTAVERRVSNYIFATYQSYAAYVESQWRLSEQFQLVSGIRADRDSRFSDMPISPRLAGIFQPNEQLALKLIYTEAFVNPAPYFSFASFNGTNFNVPNPDLEPETAQSFEINMTYTLDRMFASLSLYQSKQDKILVHADDGLDFQLLNDINGVVAAPVYQDEALTIPAGVSRTVNSGESTTKGVDLYAKFLTGMATFWGSVSYLDYESTINGVSTGLDALADTTVKLGTTTKFMEEKLTASLMASWRSDLERLDGQTAGLDSEIGSAYSLNAFANFEVQEGLDVHLNVKNLLNEEYASKGILGPTPQEKMRVLLGVTYKGLL